MPTQMFCLACMSWEPVTNGGHMIFLPPFEDEPATIEFCEGPFTFSEPPDDDFAPVLMEPDPDELEYINRDAEYFLEEA